MKFRPTIAGVVCLLLPATCLAWGYDGHRIVGEIASHYLTPCAEEAIKDLLGDQTLADVANWADEINSDRSHNWAKPLCYANVKSGSDGHVADDPMAVDSSGEAGGGLPQARRTLAGTLHPRLGCSTAKRA